MDRFEDMRCYVAVVERGSVTKAAETMSTAPSAVSRRIKELEARLGAQLLTRTTRRMSVTEAGRTFYDRCRRILADLDEAEAEAADHRSALKGPLRVAAPLAFAVDHLTPMIAEFAASHPEVQLDIDFSDRMTDLVAEGFELALRIGSLPDSSLIASKLADVHTVVCAAPALVGRHGRPAAPADLRSWPALGYVGSERGDIWRYRTADGKSGTVSPEVRLRANNGQVLCDLAVAGLGVILQPSFVVHRAIANATLVPLLTGYGWPELAIHAVYPQTRHLSARARAFIAHMRRHIGPAPAWEAVLESAGPAGGAP